MKDPGKNATFEELQKYWYWKAAQSGFEDLEAGTDSDVIYRYGKQTPQFKQDRLLANYATSRDIDIGKGSFFESAQVYYAQMSTLVANWPQRWLKTDVQRLERVIMTQHSLGLSGCKIYDLLKHDKRLIKNIIGSLRSVRRVIEKYRLIVTMLPFDRLEAWDPGHAVEQILNCDKGLNAQIKKVLARRQVKK
jgi:hypothetical protein